MSPVLTVDRLTVTRGDGARLVDELSLSIGPGEIVGLVGESGSGKTLTARAILGLLPPGVRLAAGRVELLGESLVTASEARRRALRGKELAMIFQEPLAAMNPVMTVGAALVETLRAHVAIDRRRARARAIEALREVGIPSPELRVDAYPHQLSGGMRQRVMIATSLLFAPKLLLADEPTTALDATVKADVLGLLLDRARALRTAVLFITHDLGVLAEIADRIVVLYAGQVVEAGPAAELFARPRHPYTAALLAARPAAGRRGEPLSAIPGAVPEPGRWPPGCRFHPRCPKRAARCETEVPLLADGVRCHFSTPSGAEGEA